ncbi:hypothetical protein [Desulfurispora thermophila]|uniref:hypothetical protein n=1 Tax=Desulfurispora thermophila TaxID=265470 RepID=UPI00037E63A0|nr:hypothetical protein [Desulfurispora thermophila]
MQIEILTPDTGKKAALLTWLAGQGQLQEASAGRFQAGDVTMLVNSSYLYLTTTLCSAAEKIVRLLFDIEPVPYATGFYQLTTRQKMLVTAAARPLNEIWGRLESLEHLDIAAGELAGRLVHRHHRQDVALLAEGQLLVQDGVAVCQLRLSGQFRESRQICQQCLDTWRLAPLLDIFTVLQSEPVPPLCQPPRAELQTSLPVAVLPELMAAFPPASIQYRPEQDGYAFALGGAANYLLLRPGGSQAELRAELVLTAPRELDDRLLFLCGPYSWPPLRVGQRISRLVLSPADLLGKLGFVKEGQFYEFAYAGSGVLARYHIDRRDMLIWAEASWPQGRDELTRLFAAVEELAGRVISLAL